MDDFLSVDKDFGKQYKFAPLTQYSLKQRFVIRAADILFYALIRVICRTLKYNTVNWENFEAIEAAAKVPIYTFWHDRIFAGTYFFRQRKIVVITSQSLDGEYIARFIQRLGYGTVRGSSTRGGVGALVEMIRLMKKGVATAFTVDGPRGPRYIAKTGPLLLAKKTGNPVMPFVVEPRKYWTINSWDKMQIPKPFTKIAVIIGKPIYVSPDSDDQMLEIKLQELQYSLDELVKCAKEYT